MGAGCAQSKDEGEGDGRALARLAACMARGVGLEGLRLGHGEMELGYWRDHGCFVGGTQEGRRAIPAAAEVPYLDGLARRGGDRGGRSQV